MIDSFINYIYYRREYSLKTLQDEDVYTFSGDGQGDFEDFEDSARKEVVIDYINQCNKQIEIAKKYLKDIYGEE